jgi:hypothetical protein
VPKNIYIRNIPSELPLREQDENKNVKILYILRKESRFSEFDTMCLNGERNQ